MPGTITCSVSAREMTAKAAGRELNRERDVSRSSGGRRRHWEHAGTIRLPKAVRYKDYSSLDFRNGCLTVISQASSAMWVGRLRAQPAGLEDLFEDDGQLYPVPPRR